MDSVRMDKWLWAARFFKTRALAADSCDMGRVWSNDHQAKAARDVRVGDVLRVKNEGGDFVVEVLGLSSVRGPAAAWIGPARGRGSWSGRAGRTRRGGSPSAGLRA
jgi:ribosome-associated heat shock protein Hsp15